MPAFLSNFSLQEQEVHKRVTKFDFDLTEYEHCCLSQVLHQLIIKKRKISKRSREIPLKQVPLN